MVFEITPENLCDIETPTYVRLSSDGRYAVWTLRPFWIRKTENVVSALWMGEVGKEKSGKQLTRGNFNDTSPQFSPDGKYLSFVSDRAKAGKASAIYLLPLDGGEAFPITPAKNEAGINSYKWSPDSKSIMFLGADEKSEERKKKEEDKDDAKVYGEYWPYARLKSVSVESKEITTLVTGNFHVNSFTSNKEGDRIAFAKSDTPDLNEWSKPKDVQIINLKDKSTTQVFTFPSAVDEMTWYQDTIYWIGCVDPIHVMSSSRCLYKISLSTGDKEYSKVAYGIDSCVQELKTTDNSMVAFVKKALAERLECNSEIIYSKEQVLRSWDVAEKNGTITLGIVTSTVEKPDEVYSVVQGKTCQLSNHNEEFATLNIATATPYQTKAEDGTVVDGILCLPKSLANSKGPHKTVVLVHGGPYDSKTNDFEFVFQWPPWLFSLGYQILYPNYRGGKANGNEYAKAVRYNAQASYQDVVALVKQGVADNIIDEKRVAIAGWSQGGYMSYLSVVRDSTFHYTAAVCGAGISDWDTMAFTSDLPAFETDISGPAPWDGKVDDTTARHSSPIFHMNDIHTPVLILHGEEDARVPVEQAIGFHRGMLAKGKECEMVLYPRETHGWPIPFERAHVIQMLHKIKEFLGKHLA